MCCVVHLLWNLILYSYVVCSSILKFDSQADFKFNNVCVLCVHLFHQLLWIMSCSLIFKWASSTILFVCYVFVYFVNCSKSYNLILEWTSNSTLFVCCVFICFINCCGSYDKFIKRKLHQANQMEVIGSTSSLGLQYFLKFFCLPLNLMSWVSTFNVGFSFWRMILNKFLISPFLELNSQASSSLGYILQHVH